MADRRRAPGGATCFAIQGRRAGAGERPRIPGAGGNGSSRRDACSSVQQRPADAARVTRATRAVRARFSFVVGSVVAAVRGADLVARTRYGRLRARGRRVLEEGSVDNVGDLLTLLRALLQKDAARLATVRGVQCICATAPKANVDSGTTGLRHDDGRRAQNCGGTTMSRCG